MLFLPYFRQLCYANKLNITLLKYHFVFFYSQQSLMIRTSQGSCQKTIWALFPPCRSRNARAYHFWQGTRNGATSATAVLAMRTLRSTQTTTQAIAAEVERDTRYDSAPYENRPIKKSTEYAEHLSFILHKRAY